MKKGKALNVKVPKRIAGMKIPKTVRKGPVVDFLNSIGRASAHRRSTAPGRAIVRP